MTALERQMRIAAGTPGANCPERSDSDEAGQFVGKRAGNARTVAQEGAKRRPEPRRRRRQPSQHRDIGPNQKGRPQAARLVQAKS